MKFDAVVVLYHPDETIVDNIISYINNVEKLYIVDNSEKKNAKLIKAIQSLSPKCIYIDNDGNQGIAHALNVGAKKAIKDDADWLLTMDQDSKFEGGKFLQLLDFTKKQDDTRVGIVSPFHQSVIITKHNGIMEEVLITMTSGNFISLYAYKKINGFDERFFIDAVDWDYCIRLNLNSFKVIRLNEVFLKHELGNNARKIKTSFGKERLIQNYNHIRRYYITRNKLLMVKLYYRHYSELSFRWAISILADIRNILLYEEKKILKLKAILAGIRDFILGRFYEK